ncbi:uncharacterized protein BT62DRAFT_921290 [Guyanagaster necrorhizus]|uniref:Uncharacterized protein n=1 Tax=Guyanagaster necrorhizus TaxID=856835 RepID=A0A9P7VQA9_9AGAR|nr:uncharacterized protein BT62DRAFT_921290 [Guyanagaster necrorhizus MCA 3950]KAG7444510.1 hypothetical protein BT62DRAFT_921290 [Guyanagaster necrorhizus MCA 3950]
MIQISGAITTADMWKQLKTTADESTDIVEHNQFMTAYLGSTENNPTVTSHEFIAIILEENRCQLEKAGGKESALYGHKRKIPWKMKILAEIARNLNIKQRIAGTKVAELKRKVQANKKKERLHTLDGILNQWDRKSAKFFNREVTFLYNSGAVLAKRKNHLQYEHLGKKGLKQLEKDGIISVD